MAGEEGKPVFPNLRFNCVSEEKILELIKDPEHLMTAEVSGQALDWWRHPSGAVIVYPTQTGLLEFIDRAGAELEDDREPFKGC